ncbi:MAG: hypothetical protein ACREK5_06410 [Gemmatimonadota bacterium]
MTGQMHLRCGHGLAALVEDADGAFYCGSCRQDERRSMPCGHPASEVVTADEGTSYCRVCEREVREGWQVG